MKLPALDEPERYRGLYVYDFGGWCAVGYTAEEIAVLMESPKHRGGQAYKIHRAGPYGRLELRGVSAVRIGVESGMFFYRHELENAKADYAALEEAAELTAPPCQANLCLAQREPADEQYPFVTALIFTAEYEDEIGRWLNEVGFMGGDIVEAGVSHVSNHNAEGKTVLARQQFVSPRAIQSRSADEVLASVRRAVQR